MAKSKNRVQGSYVCDICHKSFSRSDVVTRHKNNVHFSRRASVGRQSRRRSCNYCVFSKLRCSGGVPCDNCRKRNIVCDPGPAQSGTDTQISINHQHGETHSTPIYDQPPSQNLPNQISGVERYHYGPQNIASNSQHHPLNYPQGPDSSAPHSTYSQGEPGQSSSTPIFGTEYRFAATYPGENDLAHVSPVSSSYQNTMPQSSYDSAYSPNNPTQIYPGSSLVYAQYQGTEDKSSSYYSQPSHIYYGIPSAENPQHHTLAMHMNNLHSHSENIQPPSMAKTYPSFPMYPVQSSHGQNNNPAVEGGFSSNDGSISSAAHTYNHGDPQDHQRTASLDEEILNTWNSEVDWLKPKPLAPGGNNNNTTSKYSVSASASVSYSLIPNNVGY